MPSLMVLASAALVFHVAPAGAVVRGKVPRQPRAETQLVLSSLGPGASVRGFIADASSTFDPVLDGYPAGNPTEGFTPKDEGFAGIIHARPPTPAGAAELSLYCIDISTITNIGFGYVLGTWNAAKEKGLVRKEGKEYVMKDGDIVHFLFNV